MSLNTDSQDELSAHLRACEEALLDQAVRRNHQQVAELLTEDFLEFGSSGKVWARDQILELLEAEDYHPLAMEDFQCALLAETVALVIYRAVRTDARTGEKASSLRSSLWTNESGAWRLRFHQGTPANQI